MSSKRLLIFFGLIIVAVALFWLGQQKTSAQCGDYDGDGIDDCAPTPIYGCPDPDAINYNPNATDDDGSCAYIIIDILANGAQSLTIPYNSPATISWSSAGATACTVSPSGWTGTSGSESSGNLTATTTYTADCSRPSYTGSDSVVVTVSAPVPPTISSFTASPGTIVSGSSSTLSWSVSNATSLSIDQGIGSVSGSSVSVSPGATTTYTLTASNPSGSVIANTTVTVLAPSSLSAAPATVMVGNQATVTFYSPFPSATDWIGLFYPGDPDVYYLDWVYTSSCTQTPSSARSSGSCPMTIPAATTYEFRLFADDGFTRLATSNQVTGTIPTPAATVAITCGLFSAQSCAVSNNTATTISWTSTNATSCSVSPTGWTGTSGSGYNTGNLTTTTTYTADCTGPGGSAAPDSVTVTVAPPATAGFVEKSVVYSPAPASFGITLDDPAYQAYRATLESSGASFSVPYCGSFLGCGAVYMVANICMYETFTTNWSCVTDDQSVAIADDSGCPCVFNPYSNLEYPALASSDYDPAHNFDGAMFYPIASGAGSTAAATVFGRRVFINSFDAYIP
ncbi:MAG: hypothetical protein A2660_00790 [Candidatus Doudnabacteria bacterium RIFCSPHIGHO2_01_FULL_45_18]|uniref:Uncharacterized protein n=1 Tax=Candidatus Doudnabacteria bacterium RIFCSPHIGHO2_01_FULL_45_18 TaxID=1817823 RepID=A0A1F5NSH9_9BACT|nr:MAG: hypothetical protein A2660_00790 [Candidatus Doudnabacteria bacterium RIFCSPHIGHO2_01_FULL_45_18]